MPTYLPSVSQTRHLGLGRRISRYDYCDIATRFTQSGGDSTYVKLIGTVYVSFKSGDNDDLSLGFLRDGRYTRENEADNKRLADLVRKYQRGDGENYNHGFSAEITRGFSTIDPGRAVSRDRSLSFPTLIQWSTGADYSPCSILEYALNKESSLYLAFGDTTNGDHSPGYLYSLNSLLKRNGLGSRRYPWSEASTASYYTVDRPITVCFKSTKGKNDHLFEDGTA